MKKGRRVTAAILAALMAVSLLNQVSIPATAMESEATGVAEGTYPAYSDNTEGVSSTTKVWEIRTKEDWLKAVSDSKGKSSAFSGFTFYLTSDIDMEGTPMDPLAYGASFQGTIDGQGHVFQNISITETISTATTPVGLVGTAGASAVIKNLGIESGSILVTFECTSSDGSGTGSIAGNASAGATFYRCWNGASVTLYDTTTKNASVSGFVGRGNPTVVDCYNIGSVSRTDSNTSSHASGLDDWANAATAQFYNSFNAGTVDAKSYETGVRGNATVTKVSNTYMVADKFEYSGTPKITVIYAGGVKEAYKQYDLFTAAYYYGELAWKLNANYVSVSGFDRTYYTVKDGKTVYGTEENQERRITLHMVNGDVSEDAYVYLPGGSSYTLPKNATYEVTDGSADIVDGVLLSLDEDVTITVTTSEEVYPQYSNNTDGITKSGETKEWGIYTAADYLKLVKDSSGNGDSTGWSFHFANDVDMEGIQMRPLFYGASFKGTFDGHGYVIKNILINEEISDSNVHMGFICYAANTAIIQNFGIESGKITVNYTYGTGDKGIGAVLGSCAAGASLYRCWNGADVTVIDENGVNPCVSGLVGRGNPNIVDCYNIGTITCTNSTNGGHAAGLNDWMSGGIMNNSFNAGTLVASGVRASVRYNSAATRESLHKNTYLAGELSYSTPYATAAAAYQSVVQEAYKAYDLTSEAYTSGELAYRLNQEYVEVDGYEKTYYTVLNGKTVFGSEDNQVRKITLNVVNTIVGETDTAEVYAVQGSSYTLPSGTYAVQNGDVTIEGDTFVVPAGDVVIQVETESLYVTNLQAAIAKYDGKDLKYFKDSESLKNLIAEASTKIEKLGEADGYTTQEEVNADTEALGAFEYVDAPNLPNISERTTYSDAPGYMIESVADLVAVGKNLTDYTEDQTLYLATDLDLTSSGFNGMEKLYASFDGMGHTVSNYTGTKGFFTNYYGSSIKNLILKDSEITSASAIAAVVSTFYSELTVENVTVENTTVAKKEGATANCIGVLISQLNRDLGDKGEGNLTVRNCQVLKCIIDISKATGSTSSGDASLSNIGMIMGCVNPAKALFDQNIVANCEVTCGDLKGVSMGAYIGECTGADVTIKNSAIYNNKLTFTNGDNRRGALVGGFKTGGLTVSNMLIYNNEGIRATLISIAGNYQSLSVHKVYYDKTEMDNLGVQVTRNYRSDLDITGVRDVSGDPDTERADFRSGAAIYKANKGNSEDESDWAIDSEGNIYFADDTHLAAVRVKLTKEDYSKAVGDATESYYTDDKGLLLKAEAAKTFASDLEWTLDGDPVSLDLTQTFAENVEYKTVVNNIGAKLSGISATLGGSVDLNYYVQLTDEFLKDASASVSMTIGGEEIKTLSVSELLSSTKEVDGEILYAISCPVNSDQMTEKITITFKNGAGETVESTESTVAEYANAIIKSNAYTQTTKNLVKAMLNYGASAQTKFAYNDNEAANKKLGTEDQTLGDVSTDDLASFASAKEGAVTGLTYSGTSLLLYGDTVIRHYFKIAADTSIDEYTFTLEDGTVLTPVWKAPYYYVEIPDVGAKDLGTMYKVSASKGEETFSVTYGVMTYVKNTLPKQTEEKEINLRKALYWYYAAAKDYRSDSQAKVMSYNVFYMAQDAVAKVNTSLSSSENLANAGEYVIKDRVNKVLNLITEEDPDILLLQEIKMDWPSYIKEYANEKGYSYYGYSRDTGKSMDEGSDSDEYAPILWKSSKYNLVQSGHFWASSTPDVVGSNTWDDGTVGQYRRCINWVILKEKSTGAQLLVMSYHGEPSATDAVSVNTVKLLNEKIQEIQAEYGTLPVVVGGDWNATPSSTSYTTFASESGYNSVRDFAVTRETIGSFNNWTKTSDYTAYDHIFISTDMGAVSYEVLDEEDFDTESGCHISDHSPIQAIVTY